MNRFVLPMLLPVLLPAADSRIVPGINAFSVESYKRLAATGDNLISSPFNIAVALSMVLAGARGQTAVEIESLLHVPDPITYDASLGSLLADLSKTGNTGGNELLTANGLWVQKDFAIQPAYERTLSGSYQAPPTPVDFIGDSKTARSRINDWTREHTKEKIQNLFPQGSLDARTRLVLSSAIYFYGKWQAPFLTSNTHPAPFILSTGSTTANFMNQTSQFGYTETPSAQVLEMRYAGTGLAFDILLPKAATRLAEMEKSLTLASLTGWLGTLATRKAQVSLPKFRVESEFTLDRDLPSLGMPSAFTNEADFSGISSKPGLRISHVAHKAFVDVSEQGTEAAAATGVGVGFASLHQVLPPVVFRADHPFLFLIRDTRSEVILFMGRLTNPR